MTDSRPTAPAEGLYLFERHPQPMWIYDVATLAFLTVNAAAVKSYGWTAAEFRGMTLRDIRPPEDVDDLETAVYGRAPGHTEGRRWRHLLRGGELIHVEISASDITWDGRAARLVTAVNVSDQVATEARLERLLDEVHAERERLRLIVEGSEQVFFYVHDNDGVFEYVSPSVHAVLGYTAEALVGRHYEVLSGRAETSVEVKKNTDAALVTGESQPPYVAFNRHRDGHTVIVEVTESPVIEAGKVRGMQGFARDITERRELETQLLQAQKMEAVGRLAGGIAHDFNNILTAIRGHAELLLADDEVDALAHDDILSISRGADRATSLTRQLLAFSRKQVLRPRALDLGRVAGDLSSMLERLLGTHVVLRTEVVPDLWPVRADPTQIEQVVLNLVMNARDSMDNGGEIRVSLRNVGEPETGHFAGLPAGEYVELAVADTGRGIDPGDLVHIFEPFFTTRGEGTGLGLATVYGITKQSGGYIFVDTEPGQGTVFRVLLQRVHEKPDGEPAEVTASAGMRGSETVLLAEDEEPVRTLVARVLRHKGYRVLEASSGGMALDVATEHAGRIHLLITDVVMPGMGGDELAQRLRQLRPDVSVLFVSGYAEAMISKYQDDSEQGAFLEKPFTPFDLARAVRAALDRS